MEYTRDSAPYKPTNITLSRSKLDVSNRLFVEWSLTTHDEFGFITDPDSCGSTVGHTPPPLSSYIIQWDRDVSMKSSQRYVAAMAEGDGSPLVCCKESK